MSRTCSRRVSVGFSYSPASASGSSVLAPVTSIDLARLRLSEQTLGVLVLIRPQPVPGFQFANFLREVITRARRHNVLPPPSRPTSPISGPAQVPRRHQLEESTVTRSTPGKDPSPSASFPIASDAYAFGGRDGQSQPFDFSYAEHLFAHPGSFSTPSHGFVSIRV